jgi:hypothetical protein
LRSVAPQWLRRRIARTPLAAAYRSPPESLRSAKISCAVRQRAGPCKHWGSR